VPFSVVFAGIFGVLDAEVPIFACTGLVFVGIMFTLTFNDHMTHGLTPLAGH